MVRKFSRQETQEKEKSYRNKLETIKKMVIGTYISIITLNENGLNAQTERHLLAEWIQKKTRICCLQETHVRPRDTYRLKVRGWKKTFHANGNQKKAGVAILISDKIDLKIKIITRVEEGHYIMIKGSIKEEDINCKYLCTEHRNTSIHKPNANAIKGEIDSNTIRVGDFNTSLSGMDR